MISGATRLMDENEADLVAINTDGLLAGPGRRLKASKIEALEPDVLVGIGNDPDLAAVLGAYPCIPSYILAPSVHAFRKSEGAHRSARREAFRVYFADAREQTAPLRLVQAGTTPNGCLAAGMLVGLTASTGRHIGLGLVTNVDEAAGMVGYPEPPLTGQVAHLLGSGLVLDEAFTERRAPTGDGPPHTRNSEPPQ
jgi:polynucleotide 5'-hydroxyl-kinase GRC3/NOL9